LGQQIRSEAGPAQLQHQNNTKPTPDLLRPSSMSRRRFPQIHRLYKERKKKQKRKKAAATIINGIRSGAVYYL
jgi:hypothetical protein